MPVIEVPAYYLQCDGPAAVPWESVCSAKFPLSYNKDELEEESITAGWGAEGRKRFCPQHVPATAQVLKPSRKSRITVPDDAENQ